ncbi:MAG: 2-oxoacid:acceptor oxidoreductase subunit alpha [Anaerolineaceae bacterium]
MQKEKLKGNPMSNNSSDRKINDFVITFGTVNGSGSATANTTIMRALFQMGIPVSGKNIFPSNIQGLPTWYTLRLSKDGYLARVEEDDIVIAMNPSTIRKELESLVPGGVLFYPDDLKFDLTREDIVLYPMPVKKIIKDSDVTPTLRDYVANMVYVGVLCQMIGIKLDMIESALNFHFKNKEKPVSINMNIINMAANWAKENLIKTDRYWVEPMKNTQGCIMSDGNTAGALGSLFGGLQFCAWYPITPASSLAETIHEFIPVLRKDNETGEESVVIVQAEDELAAIGMTVGAGWGGLRALTSTSGPGLSLMTEYLGLAYYSEVPVVIWDVQRVGPSTGLPTRTAQCDLTFVYFLGHGDTNSIILLPGSVNECFEFGWKALDIAERLQSPVFVLSDLDLGMNEWITPKFNYPNLPIDRGKILWEEDFQKMLDAHGGSFGRYNDVDGDNIPYRTVVGNQHPKAAYFTRGTGHDRFANYSEDGEVWMQGMDRLKRKYEHSVEFTPTPELDDNHNRVGIITSGSAYFPVIEARDILKNKGLNVDLLRIRALPIHDQVKDFIKSHDYCYVVELNRDGQLQQIISLSIPDKAINLISISKMDGFPLTAKWIVNEVLKKEEVDHGTN